MVRPTDQNIIAIKKIVIFTDPKERGHATPQGATWSSTGVSMEAEGEKETGKEPFFVVSMGRNREGRVSRFRIG